jgi:hypothetical protein
MRFCFRRVEGKDAASNGAPALPEFAASLAILASPPVLFFALGIAAALARSDLALPESLTKGLSLYLMLCIGFKGGVEARAAGLDVAFLMAATFGLGLGAVMPVLAWPILRRLLPGDRATAGALAAAYGSVSVITFAAAQDHLRALGIESSGFMAGVLALMEAPAILTALMLMNVGSGRTVPWSQVARHAVLGAASVMLLGSFLIGAVTGQAGFDRLDTFVGPLFQGVLCLFLLQLGVDAAGGLRAGGARLSPGLVAYCVAFPFTAGVLAMLAALGLGLGAGNAILFAALAGSASYIAVPAAMRLAAPNADPALYVTGPLAITFPFNLLVGIPCFAALASLTT